jgi:hypothetical protein
MTDDLEAEGERLRQRLAALERQHDTLHGRPHDRKAHEAHRMDLLDYQADVRDYREPRQPSLDSGSDLEILNSFLQRRCGGAR